MSYRRSLALVALTGLAGAGAADAYASETVVMWQRFMQSDEGMWIIFATILTLMLMLVSTSRSHSRRDPILPDHLARSPYFQDPIIEQFYGCYVWNEDGMNGWLSPLAGRLLNLQEGHHSLSAFKQSLSAGDAEKVDTAIKRIMLGKDERFRLVIQSANRERYIECLGLRQEGDKVAGYTLWLRDVTEQERLRMSLQEKLNESESQIKRLTRILDEAPYPIWERDQELKLTYCNRSYAEAVEQPVETILANGAIELDKRLRQAAERVRDTSEIMTEDCHIVAKGNRQLFHVVQQPLFPMTGDSVRYAGYAYDISRQEAIDAELRRYKSAQGDMLESSNNAMVVYSADMKLQSYNNAFVRLWGLEESWLEEHPSYGDVLERMRENRLLPEQANFPAFKKQSLELFTRLIKPQEEFYYLPDGRVLRVIIIPHALGGLMFTYEDVTDRLALERNYNTLIAVQRASLDNLHEGVAVFGEDGRLRLSNPEYANIWGVDSGWLERKPHVSEIIDRAESVLRTGDDWLTTREQLIGQITNREHLSGRLFRADDKVLDWRCVPLPDGAVLTAFYDVTDSIMVEQTLREKNEALEEADRVKTEFLASMSYELRSPLTSIMGFSEALGNRFCGELNDKQDEYIDAINQSSHKLMNLINDILDLASIEAGYLRLSLSAIQIPHFLESVIEMQEEHTRNAGLNLIIECPDDIGTLRGDEARLKQVMFNMLHNAVKYTGSGGTVTVGAEAKQLPDGQEAVALWVEDTGIGIPGEDQPFVFERFHKAGGSRGHKSGAGLGLSMVKRFTELHGGQVSLDSDMGKGTRITCILPRQAVQPSDESISMIDKDALSPRQATNA